VTTQRIDIDTLIALTDPRKIEALVGPMNADSESPALTTFTSGTSDVFVGGSADEAEVLEAMKNWDERVAIMKLHSEVKPVFAGRTASGNGSSTSSSSRSSANSSQNDYKYIPRMLRYGLTSTNRYGRVNAFGKRSLWERSRFGQQSRELNRLRSKYDQHVGGNVVSRD
jgi:hypothetical protein